MYSPLFSKGHLYAMALLLTLAISLLPRKAAAQPQSGKVYRIVNRATNQYMALPYTNDDATLITLDENSAGANCLFKITGDNTNGYVISSLTTGKVIDLYGSSTADGAQVGSYSPSSGNNQKWRFFSTGGYGYLNAHGQAVFVDQYRIYNYLTPINTANTRCLSPTGTTVTNSTPVSVSVPVNSPAADRWGLEEVNMQSLEYNNLLKQYTFQNFGNGSYMSYDNTYYTNVFVDGAYHDISKVLLQPESAISGNGNWWLLQPPAGSNAKEFSYMIAPTSGNGDLKLENGDSIILQSQAGYLTSGTGHWFIWKDHDGDYRIANSTTGQCIVPKQGSGVLPPPTTFLKQSAWAGYTAKWTVRVNGNTISGKFNRNGNTAPVVATVFPNPVYDQLSLRINYTATDRGVVKIWDLQGRLLLEAQAPLQPGDNTLSIPCLQLKGRPGTYLLQLTDSKGTPLRTQKIQVR